MIYQVVNCFWYYSVNLHDNTVLSSLSTPPRDLGMASRVMSQMLISYGGGRAGLNNGGVNSI